MSDRAARDDAAPIEEGTFPEEREQLRQLMISSGRRSVIIDKPSIERHPMYAFWEIIASNAMVATILAIGAMLWPRLEETAAVHAFWVVVLLKLFTPPLITTELPFAFHICRPRQRADPQKATLKLPTRDQAKATAPAAMTDSRDHRRRRPAARARESLHGDSRSRAVVALHDPRRDLDWRRCGTGLAYAVRIRRFAGVIRESEAAPASIRTMVAQLSSRLGLGACPTC